MLTLADIRKRALPSLNRVLGSLPSAFRLLGVPQGVVEITPFRKELIYGPQWSEQPVWTTTRTGKPGDIVFSSEPRRLKGGGVLFLEGGISDRNGTAFTAQGQMLVSDGIVEFSRGRLSSHFPSMLPKLHKVTGPIAVLATPGFNYFHWLFDVLPKFHLLEKALCSEFQVLLHISRPLQWEMLDLLRVPRRSLINAIEHSFVTGDELLIPFFEGPLGPCVLRPAGNSGQITAGHVGDACVNAAEWVCNFLKSSFPADSTTPSARRIYISRRDASKGRAVANEDRLIEVLAARGFESVCLSGMTFSQQRDLFAQAEVVVAGHGASLANLVFCQPGAICIELFGPNYISDLYATLSHVAGLRYYYLVGKGERYSGDVKSNDHYEVDIKELKDLLDLAGIEG